MIKLRQNIHDLDVLHKSTKLQIFKDKYKEAKNIFQKELSNLRKQTYSSQIVQSSNIAKESWKIINKFRKAIPEPQTGIINIRHEGKVVKDPKEVCNIFNKYFISAAANPVNRTKVSNKITPCPIGEPPFVFKEVSEQEIGRIINNLKNKYSSGWDGLCSVVIKKCNKELGKVITHLINCSIREHTFPDVLKWSTVKPVHKKGSKEEVSNFRPISLIPIFSKVFEMVLLTQLSDYFSKNNLLTETQHGFRKDRSTITAITEFLHKVYSDLDQGMQTAGIFLDLTKAFDSVNHELLLSKLQAYNLNVTSIQMLTTYLIHRKQCTKMAYKINDQVINCQSKYETVTQGVPQGSVLGPFLFLVYINDIEPPHKSQLVTYADDTSLLFVGKENDELTQVTTEGLGQITNYFQDQGLKVNISKSQLMPFKLANSHQTTINNIGGIEAVDADDCRFLGIYLDTNLRWVNHINSICNKMSSALYLISQLSKVVCLLWDNFFTDELWDRNMGMCCRYTHGHNINPAEKGN